MAKVIKMGGGLDRTSLANKLKMWKGALTAKRWSVLLLIMAFLLGRATLLEQFAPFAIAYFGVMYHLRRDLAPWTGLFLLAGSLASYAGVIWMVLPQLLIFTGIQKWMNAGGKGDLVYVPLLVFAASLPPLVAATAMGTGTLWYGLLMAVVEALLAAVLSLIFIQSLPVLTLSRKNVSLKSEEIICLIILLASVLTGTAGWVVQGIAVDHVLSRYLLLVFALVGGAPVGASVGVVSGMILSMANMEAIKQMSLLAFGGMLAGLLKEGRKWAVGIGMMLGCTALSVYMLTPTEAMASAAESAIAFLLFLFTPQGMLRTVAQYVPGTAEHAKTQVDYARRVRDLIAGRVEHFSEVFRRLSGSFKSPATADPSRNEDNAWNDLMGSVASRTCASCWKKTQCWEKQPEQTCAWMGEMLAALEKEPEFGQRDIRLDWKRSCVKTEQVLQVMKQQSELYRNDLRWRRQIKESRQLVAEQLFGVSQVMDDLAKEIKREGQEMFLQEEQIRQALSEVGLTIYSIDIISLDVGNVEIEMVHSYNRGFDECRKLIAPMLSDILGENITVKQERFTDQGHSTVVFGSAKEYEVTAGAAGAAKGGELLSGDSFSTAELGNGKFAVALSDGMGNGERAHAESKAALSVLEQLLQSGMDEKLAIKSVNSVLLLRSPDEIFATIDLALIDLYNAKATFLKIGSAPSFIKRKDQVFPVHASNLPAGILQEIDVDVITVQLEPGDTIIMMSDGVYDSPGPAANKDLWIKRIIREMRTGDPQEAADCLLEATVRGKSGEITDDMTVIAARIEKHVPEWSTFRWPGLERLERPKTVS